MSKATKELIEIVEKKASKANYGQKAQELLRQGADITAPTNNGSMIHSVTAEEKRRRRIEPLKADNCQYLIQVLEKEASDRLTAQVFSANGGNLNEMHTLVQLKASCYQSVTFGPVGLLGSLLKQSTVPIRLDVIQFLIESDLHTKNSLTTVDNQQQTCLSLAKNNPKCPQDVINYLQAQLDNILNQIPFERPQIDPNEVLMLIRRGANIEATDKNRNTVLSNAVIANNLELVRVLVSAGSNTSHKNSDGLTPLQIAKNAAPRNLLLIPILEAQDTNAELKHLIETKKSKLTPEEVHTLIENGANINATIVNNDSLLHLLIASKGTAEMVTAFVNDFNADISATNTNGHRPIETCILLDKDPFACLLAFFRLPKMTTALFNNSKLNKTILQFAIEQKRSEAAKIIQNELNLRLWNCIARANTKENNNETIITEFYQLLTYGAQINHKHHDNEYREWTVLHLGCKIATQRLVQYLIKNFQADYMLQNHDGDYPISIAAECGHLPIVEYLRNLPNSSVNVFNKDKQTPLHLATKNHHLLVVRYLVKWGADHQAQNLSQQTPLDIARTNVSKIKEEKISDSTLIRFLEQLNYSPPMDGLVQPMSNATKPSYDLDTCELVAPVIVNPIHMSTEDTESALGKKSRGILTGTPNDNLHDAAKHGYVAQAQKAIGDGADIRHQKGTHNPFKMALMSGNEYSLKLKSTMLNSVDYSTLQIKANGCQQIAYMIQQITQTKLVEAIDQSNAGRVMEYHVAGATLTADLLYRTCNVSDNVEIVDYLLTQNTNIYQAMIDDSSSNCPYRIAKKKKFNKVATYLKYRLSLECTKAVKENNLERVKKLVYAGASVDMHDTNNLSETIQQQNTELIQFLCDNGAKIPSNWFTGKTITLEPTLSQQLKPEVVFCINQCLINRRLRFAAASGDLNGVIQCQRLGANIDSVNCYGSTALLCTIQYGNYFRIVHALVSCGASMLHSNEDVSISLIDLAKKKNYEQIGGYLSKELNIQFLSAIIDNNRQSAERFALLGADFKYEDEQKRTALHHAVQHHGVDLVNWLCERGSNPSLPDINGDFPLILATEKGNYAMVKFFVTKYPPTKKQTNKAGLTALQIAQKLKFTRIAELIETGKDAPESSENQDNEPKHDYETLVKASRNGDAKIIQEFVAQRYESKEEKRRLCYELIQVAKKTKQFQIVAILEPYYNTKLRNELPSDMEIGSAVYLSEHYKKILFAALSGLSTIIANSPVVLDPDDLKTYEDLFSGLTARTEKNSQRLEQVANEQDVKKLIAQDEMDIKEELTKINEQLEQSLANKDSLQARVQDIDGRLFEQQELTALQRKEFLKEKEDRKQQLATIECSIFLSQRQQEATLIRQNTINFIKGNSNLIMFYRTIENILGALFYSALAAQGGYVKTELTTKYAKPLTVANKIPIMNLASISIKAVLSPALSKLNEKQQKKEWYNISTLGNIEELTRIASDTAGLVTLYYREQIQRIEPWQKIKGSNAFNDMIHSLKHAYDVRPEKSEQIAIVMVAEYITNWIMDGFKLGKSVIDPTEPLPQQLWLWVAKKDPINHGKMTQLTDTVGISVGQQKIPFKTRNSLGAEIVEQVQLRYLIGCVSVLGNDGIIYQYPVHKDSSENELKDLEQFGYVYVKPFISDEKILQSIVEGRQLKPAKRDKDGNILTRFDDIIEHAQAYAIQNDHHVNKSLITKETANQIAQVIREQKIFADLNDVKEELRKAQETIELSVDILREEIQQKTEFYQTSIDAAHEQIKQESETNREIMKKDNEIHYEHANKKLKEKLNDMTTRLEQLVETRMNDIEQQMQQKTQQILAVVEAAQAQSLQAIAEAKQATQISQQMLKQATQAAAQAQSLVQWAEQQRQEFQSGIKTCEATVKETAAAQTELCNRTILEMRAKIERNCERLNEAANQSAANAQQSALNAQDVQTMTKKQLDLQKKETEKTIGEAKEARQQSERAVAEAKKAEGQAKRAADAATTALNKVNHIQERVERTLERRE